MVDGACPCGWPGRRPLGLSKHLRTVVETRDMFPELREHTDWLRSGAGLEASVEVLHFAATATGHPGSGSPDQHQARGQVTGLSDHPFSLLGKYTIT